MSDLDLTEATEAAVLALCIDHGHVNRVGNLECRTCNRRARDVLAVAAPLIERQVRERIAADIMAAFAKDQRRTAFLDAARVARGKS